MASLEVWKDGCVTVYERSDAGQGVELTVVEGSDSFNTGGYITFGGAALCEMTTHLSYGMPLPAAFDVLDRLDGWTQVKLNGQMIWECRAVKQLKAELRKQQKQQAET